MEKEQDAPLAVRMRPRNLEEFVGQSHVLGEQTLLRKAIKADRLSSLIVYGPPGTGKTSLGHVISQQTHAQFTYLNAALSSSGEVKEVMREAARHYKETGRKTLLFVDEIHRFNKHQQDILLAFLESPFIVIIGATLYNPFYFLAPALISRSIVVEFKPLTQEEVAGILRRAAADTERGLGKYRIAFDDAALAFLAAQAGGDARKGLNALEIGVRASFAGKEPDGPAQFTLALAQESIQKKQVCYDRDESGHYDTISSFIKSVRGSDADSALYWLAKMLYAGEDPRFIARRLIICAAEDIGNADPFSLVLATSCFDAVEYIGMPEARIVLSETTIYCALAPKSNASCEAIEKAMGDIETQSVEVVPEALKMKTAFQKKTMGDTASYVSPHDTEKDVQQYTLTKKKYYVPKDAGRESRLLKREGKKEK